MDRVQLEPEDLQESNVTKRAGYARRVFFHRNTAVVMIHRSFFVAVKEEADLKRKGCLKRLCTVLLAGMLAVSSWSFAFAADEVSGDSSSAAAVEADNTAKGDTGEAEAADKAAAVADKAAAVTDKAGTESGQTAEAADKAAPETDTEESGSKAAAGDDKNAGTAVGPAGSQDDSTAETDTSIQDDSDRTSETTDVTDTAVMPESGNSGEIAVSSTLQDFVLTDMTKVTASGDLRILTLETKTTAYSEIRRGSRNALNVLAEIKGVPNSYGGYTFLVVVSSSELSGPVLFVPYRSLDGTWVTDSDYYLFCSDIISMNSAPASAAAEDTAAPESTSGDDAVAALGGTGTNGTSVPDDGKYSVADAESSAKMFVIKKCVLTVNAGVMTAVLTLSGTGYDKLYMGTAADAANAADSSVIPYKMDSDGKYTYTVPVSALDTGIAVAAHSSRENKWYDRTVTFHSDTMTKVKELEDGDYNVKNVVSSAKMFVVKACRLTSKNGVMTAVITLSGTGYDKLYLGTADKAKDAADTDMILFKTDADGKYTYTIPVSALDTGIALAAHSSRENKWYDRTVTFDSSGIEKIGGSSGGNTGGGSTDPGSGTGGDTGGNSSGDSTDSGSGDSESQHTSDTNGSTASVNSSTGLPDGVYTPDAFSWSGGTGKVSISCPKITVTGGTAYATIVFSSSTFNYVKANGNIYYTSHSGGTSTVVVPVELNQNNAIIGMTTAMSAAHEITYNIFVYLAAAAGAGSGSASLISGSSTVLDKTAPSIIGLTYQSETELKYAEYFKIYKYDKGVTLLEIDMTKDTVRDPEKEENSGNTSDTAASASSSTADSQDVSAADAEQGSGDANAETEAEANAKLYEGNIVKYLIMPEDTEIPAGLDKEVIVVKEPADKTYVSSENGYTMLDQLEQTALIKETGTEKEKMDVANIKAALESGDTVYAGKYYAPEFKKLITDQCSLAILPSDILPKDEDANDAGSTVSGSSASDSAAAKNKEPETAAEKEAKLTELAGYYATLKIPMIVDRSADEKTDLAKYEWIKAYGVLYGCEDQASGLFLAAETAAAAK